MRNSRNSDILSVDGQRHRFPTRYHARSTLGTLIHRSIARTTALCRDPCVARSLLFIGGISNILMKGDHDALRSECDLDVDQQLIEQSLEYVKFFARRFGSDPLYEILNGQLLDNFEGSRFGQAQGGELAGRLGRPPDGAVPQVSAESLDRLGLTARQACLPEPSEPSLSYGKAARRGRRCFLPASTIHCANTRSDLRTGQSARACPWTTRQEQELTLLLTTRRTVAFPTRS